MNRSVWVIAAILLFFVASLPETHAATIMLRDEASVVSDVVRLGDVATIIGSEPYEEIEALRSIAICSAPPPAEVQLLSLGTIVSALKASGADLRRLKVGGSTRVFVGREHTFVSVEELQRIFVGHVSQRTGWSQDTFIVRAPKNLDSVPVPVGVRTIDVETSGAEDFYGSVLAYFRVTVDGKPYCMLAHRFDIDRYVEALVTARKIARGTPVSASDIEVKKVEQSLLDEESLTRAEQAVGLLATRTIHPGRILQADLLTTAPVVKRGEGASVIWEGNGFRVETKGRVLEDGAANELVRVRLLSRRIVNAEVLDSGTLRIVQTKE